MLAGLILLALISGTSEIGAINLRGAEIQADDLYLPILLLILAGAMTKSAQVPFHFWLPAAMAAPTPVSAYLHSATMVKAGVYLLARVSPALGGTDSWFYLLSIAGALTMLLGAFLAFRQTDLKLILAYSTISVLGTLVMLLGVGTTVAVEAAVVTLVVHSFYKGGLFLVAGAVDHEAGTRDIRELRGLARSMPITAAIAGLAALSLAGIPPFAGFTIAEIIRANLRITLDVLTPCHTIRPGIVAVPLDVEKDNEITLLATLISLTPGSLVLDVSNDRKVIYIHAMHVRDRESLIHEIKDGFERRVLEVMR